MFLHPHRGLRTMTGEQAGFFREREDFRLDAVQQGLVITPGKIGPANAALEDHISTENNPLIREIKNYVAAGMPWGMKNLHLIVTQVQDLPIVQVNRGLGTRIDTHPE